MDNMGSDGDGEEDIGEERFSATLMLLSVRPIYGSKNRWLECSDE